LREVADEALAYERLMLAADPPGLDRVETLAAWSHGATGIGLARTAMLQLCDSPALRGDLEAALVHVRARLFAGSDDICSGILAKIELLESAAVVLDRPSLREEALNASDRTLARVAQRGRYRLGWFGGYQHPGLFQGLAGLAFSWARLAAPERLPSVALWA
jgi:lantibiotic modifying enzyme